MSGFAYVDGELHAEDVRLSAIADAFGTPCYVYSRAMLTDAYRAFDAAFAGMPHLVCYAMKANPTLAILDLFARLGGGFDIVSGGELARVIAAGGDCGKVVFSGVGKSDAEMEAALAAGILCFNVESSGELDHLAAVARRMGTRAPISFRVNPDVDPLTHPYIATGLKESKFGVALADAHALYRRAAQMPSIVVRGIDMHIGSQITELAPTGKPHPGCWRSSTRWRRKRSRSTTSIWAAALVFATATSNRSRSTRMPQWCARCLRTVANDCFFAQLREATLYQRAQRLVIERDLAQELCSAHRRFAVVDAAMNDLIRPSLYDAWHAVDPVRPRVADGALRYDVVGPIS